MRLPPCPSGRRHSTPVPSTSLSHDLARLGLSAEGLVAAEGAGRRAGQGRAGQHQHKHTHAYAQGQTANRTDVAVPWSGWGFLAETPAPRYGGALAHQAQTPPPLEAVSIHVLRPTNAPWSIHQSPSSLTETQTHGRPADAPSPPTHPQTVHHPPATGHRLPPARRKPIIHLVRPAWALSQPLGGIYARYTRTPFSAHRSWLLAVSFGCSTRQFGACCSLFVLPSSATMATVDSSIHRFRHHLLPDPWPAGVDMAAISNPPCQCQCLCLCLAFAWPGCVVDSW
ncbi:hypothetical protein DM02DRAFT_212750 [Periconia macrospinosa]|uniref:Uncharacterized protein n=1 Tax=Periconia macrospinosa TaxID=97972 RepID=A0A2V1D9E9_9PLEO|nr:hypothetical protein DM02DRAFT_212750 [Periconia macrospinosa]